MNKYKVCVYAICKNEEKHVLKWIDSMKEADSIYVLDTGSTDNTVNLLKEYGAVVNIKEIKPWRFDVARNLSLNMIPNDFDILVCTDLDEVFEKGWRKELENVWDLDTNRLRYTYNWSLDSKNKPIISFYGEKIHSRNNYKWINPVHEVLEFSGDIEHIKKTDNVILNHYPDPTKSRNCYLPLLKLAVKENPNNDRNMHYLGREYMYYKKWNKCIDTLIKHLKMPSSTWKDERSASMRFIARSYINLKRYDETLMWIDKAINEAPYLRDPYVEKAFLEYELHDYNKVIKCCLDALKITSHEKTYINEPFSFNNTIYDLLSVSYYYVNDFNNSLKYIKIALDMDPNNQRLLNNLNLIKKNLN